MKLGILLDHLGEVPGGAEAHTLALMRRALDAGDQVVLATLDGRAPDGVETIVVPAPRLRPARDRTFARDGPRRLREAGCDVVFAIRHAVDCDVYLPHGGLVDDAIAARDRSAGGAGLFKRLGRALSKKHAFFREAEHALLGRDAGPTVIAVSDDLALRIQRRYPESAGRVVTVRNGVDGAHFTWLGTEESKALARKRLSLAEPVIGLLLARHPVLKGAETAIRALAEPPLRDLARPVSLIVAGGRLPARLGRLAARLGVAHRVRTQPAVEDPRPLYAAADLLVHPTWYDPCSLVCLEALAMRLPVITTRENGVHEIMGSRGGRVLDAPGDASALAAAMHALADPETRAAVSAEARSVAEANPEAERLDRVLALCRSAGRGG